MRKSIESFVLVITSNIVTGLGALLTTLAVISGIVVIFIKALYHPDSVYFDLIAYVMIPGTFILGLFLVPVGLYIWRHKLEEEPFKQIGITDFLVGIKLNAPRNLAIVILVLTFINAGVLGFIAYEGYHFMDSINFCGKLCHSVMTPEMVAYKGSPHSKVACVECHIGPGASWFVKSKLAGLRQVIAVTFDTYSKPIPSPIHDLRPARDTCENCHWPEKFFGDRFLARSHFAKDENNTRTENVLVLKVGSGGEKQQKYGIHWHVAEENQIRYISVEDKREDILWVEYRDKNGKVVEYFKDGVVLSREEIEEAEKRLMDCMDCHNRPTHTYRLPGQALDEEMAHGVIDPSIPYIRKLGEDVLTAEYSSKNEALKKIREKLETFYKEAYPDFFNANSAKINQAINTIEDIYNTNVFPTMGITWGTYQNHIGHEYFTGCFRCHDESHKAADGGAISQDCTTCHSILAMGEENPEILNNLK